MPAPTEEADIASVGRSTRPVGGIERSGTHYKYTVQVSPAGEALAVNFDSTVPSNLAEGFRAHLVHQRWKPALDDGTPVNGWGKGSVDVVETMMAVPGGTVHPAP